MKAAVAGPSLWPLRPWSVPGEYFGTGRDHFSGMACFLLTVSTKLTTNTALH